MITEENLTNYFHIDNMSPWPCPVCNIGHIYFLKTSIRITKHENGILYHNIIQIKYRYSCSYKCSNRKCEAIVFSVGIGYGIDDIRDRSKIILRPTYFDPPIKIVNTTTKVSESVNNYLIESFRTFFINNEATANNLRIALEKILDEIGVPREIKRRKGNLSRLSLGQRIDLIGVNHKFLVSHFDAIRIIGNDGSHGTSITTNEIIMAYHIIEFLIAEIYEERSKKIISSINYLKSKKSKSFP